MPIDSRSRPRLVSIIRAQLFNSLGNQCALADDTCDGPLEIDHPWGRDWVPREVGSYQRWLRYRREAQEGMVRLLCRHHNGTVRPKRLATVEEGENAPF